MFTARYGLGLYIKFMLKLVFKELSKCRTVCSEQRVCLMFGKSVQNKGKSLARLIYIRYIQFF